MIKKITLSLLLPLLLLACTADYMRATTQRAMSDIGLRDQHAMYREADWGLSQSAHIALLPLVAEEHELGPRTATRLNTHFIQRFSHTFPHSERLEPSDSLSHAFFNAAVMGNDILITPKLVRVDNRLNSRDEVQEGRYQHPDQRRGRDTLALQLLIYEVQTGKLLDRVHLSARAAFFKEDEKLPLHLLDNAFNEAALTLARLPSL